MTRGERVTYDFAELGIVARQPRADTLTFELDRHAIEQCLEIFRRALIGPKATDVAELGVHEAENLASVLQMLADRGEA